jgi:tetratricopeptide (TPR) repeat protein
MEQALALDPEYALAYADRGLLYAASGDLERAMIDWDRALELDPMRSSSFYSRGMVYMFDPNYEECIQDSTEKRTVLPPRREGREDF